MPANRNNLSLMYHSANTTFEAAIGRGGKLTELRAPNDDFIQDKREEIDSDGVPKAIDVVIVDDTDLLGTCSEEQIENVLADRWYGFFVVRKSRLEDIGGYCADVETTKEGQTKIVHKVIASTDMILKAAGLDWLVAKNNTALHQEEVAEELPDNVLTFKRAA